MYSETLLDNGLKVVSEYMPDVQTVSLGAYVRTGSRAETAKQNGVSHMLEHMAFKGTKTRTALDIAAEVEAVGGVMNAYTSYQVTAYHLKVLHENMPLAVDIVGDILLNSTFPDSEVELERGVILQEIGQAHDTPDDLVFDLLQAQAWPDQAIGRPILGTAKTVKSLGADDLRGYMKAHYHSGNMVVAAAGRVDHKALVELVKKHFGALEAGTREPFARVTYHGGSVFKKRKHEQAHIALGFPGIGFEDAGYYAAHIWNTLLGGGMASRLFQEVREKRGLVYSVYSYLQSFDDTGLFGLYAGTGPTQAGELLPVVADVLKAATQSLTRDEVERARAQLKAGLMMSLESTNSRMGRLASNHFIHGRHVSQEETLEKINAVTLDGVLAAGRRLYDPAKLTLAAVGPVEGAQLMDLWHRKAA